MNKEYDILIPIDFTPVAKSSVNYVLGMSQKIKLTITLLHVVEKDNEIQLAENKLTHFKNNFD